MALTSEEMSSGVDDKFDEWLKKAEEENEEAAIPIRFACRNICTYCIDSGNTLIRYKLCS